MALKINMKPSDAVYVGASMITVESQSNVTLLIDGDVPVLRASEWIDEPRAGDHAARLQHVVQQMYFAGDVAGFHEDYFALAKVLASDDPATVPHIAKVNSHLARGEFYKALKVARGLAESCVPPREIAGAQEG